MMNPHNYAAKGRPYRVISVMRGGARACALAYTFFNQEGYRTSSHTQRIFRDIVDRSVLNRIDRWVMLQVLAPGGDDATLKAAVEAVGRGMKW